MAKQLKPLLVSLPAESKTLLDEFAGQAMQAIIGSASRVSYTWHKCQMHFAPHIPPAPEEVELNKEEVAKAAYEYGLEMLKEKQRLETVGAGEEVKP